ncbi:MAG: hypothetical protein ACRCW2_05870 [Cellulosilyticaceae bacterium]
MRILKLRGKNEIIIKEQIAKDYGDEALILSTHQERAQGMWGLLKKPQWVITIAIEEEGRKPQTTELTESIDILRVQMAELKAELRQKQAVDLYVQQETLAVMQEEVVVDQVSGATCQLFEKKLLAEGVHPEVLPTLVEGFSDTTTIDEGVRVLYHNVIKSFEKVMGQDGSKIIFIGPTGVGKTTTIAKLTADKVLNDHKKVTLMTADTYRIAAIEQLRTYAEILGVPLEIIYEDKELVKHLAKWQDHSDYIFIDTAGRSHKNVEQMIHMQHLIESLPDKKVYLVLNMNTQFQDLKRIIASYELIISDFEVIVTKSDETDVMGNLLNIAYCTKKPIAYLTIGQNVPDDFYSFDPHEYTKDLLGRMSYE